MTPRSDDSNLEWDVEEKEIIDYMEETSKEVGKWSIEKQRMLGACAFGFFSENDLKEQQAS
ncbi:hypothetical protein LLH00_14025 [bacterium]|nr:hypothetical protein [bacterium]